MQKELELEYEPKEINPKGRQRIFFYCHKDDFELYFDKLAKEIWSIVNNATVWYCKESLIDKIEDEQNIDNLEQMQLFVIPISTKLLYEDFVSEKLFKYALKKYIPVLPIMMEPGLEEIFNQKFGDFQILDHNNADLTAIPYVEKIKSFLQNVLTSSELVNKIKTEFVGNIFLSYRKKDRIYAQKIMKLIHSHEEFQDIAIWYDEYLIPGENFNTAINDAILKCDLFALAVSPNLLIANNYVMTIEYPQAMSCHKAILPIEVIPTDFKMMSQKFDKILKFISIDNMDEIISNIKAHLRSGGYSQKKSDPHHNYFIGMAYLHGIEVEVDRERALELISASAKKGFYDALEQLANMYYYGEGVKIDFQKAIEWQEKYVLRLEYDFNASLDVKILINLIMQLDKLSTWQYEKNMVTSAKDTIHKIIQLADLMYEKDIIFSYQLGKANIKLGDIYFYENNLSQAEKYYYSALEFFEKFYNNIDSDSPLVNIEIATLYFKIANVKQKEKVYVNANEYFIKSINLLEENAFSIDLKNVDVNFIACQNLIRCYIGLAEILVELNDLEGAKKYYSMAFNKCKICNASVSMINIITAGMGKIFLMEGNIKQAKEWYEIAVAIEKDIVEKTGNLLNKINLSKYYYELGKIEKKDGRYEQAKELLIKSIELRETLNQEYSLQNHRHSLYEIYISISEICLKQKKYLEAVTWLQKCCEICELNEKEDSNLGTMQDLFFSYARLGDAYRYIEDYLSAKKWYKKQIEIGESVDIMNEAELLINDSLEVSDADKKDPIYLKARYEKVRKCMGLTYFYLGTIEQKANDNEMALQWYDKYLQICESLVNDNRSEDNLREVCCCYNRMGNISREYGEYDKAKEWYKKNIDISIELIEGYNKIEDCSNLGVVYKIMGDMNSKENNVQDAYIYYCDALKMKEKLAKNSTDELKLDDYAMTLYLAWNIDHEEERIKKALSIYKELHERYPNNRKYEQNYIAFLKLCKSN